MAVFQALRPARLRSAGIVPSRVSARRSAARTVPRAAAKDDWVAPEPRRFYVRPDKLLDTASAAAGFLFRGTSGALTAGYSVKLLPDDGATGYAVARAGGRMTVESSGVSAWARPALPLELYEFQACPFCKRVREALTYWDLDALVYPCPRDGPTWRPKAASMSGKKQFPFLRDPNTGKEMLESVDIMKYLAETYADGVVPSGLSSPVAPLLIGLGLLPRAGRGGKYRPSKVTAETRALTLWAYEASPFCVLVREALTELEVPHLLKSVARGSPKRQELFAQTGLFQAPYLEDPNTGKSMFESAEILEYLQNQYAL